MTALTIVSNVLTRLGFSAPSVVFASTDDTVIQLRNLLNQEGPELAKGAGTDHAWTKLIFEKTFTTTAAAIQASSVPTDFGYYLDDTLWNRTTMIKYTGPVSSEEWQSYQAIQVIALPAGVFRFRGGDLLIYPTPTAGQSAAYEYVSANWCEDSGGTDKSSMNADSDVGLLDEELITKGVLWRYLAAKGLDYAEHYRTYQLEVGKAVARDGGRPKRYLHGTRPNPYRGNIPESSWPL